MALPFCGRQMENLICFSIPACPALISSRTNNPLPDPADLHLTITDCINTKSSPRAQQQLQLEPDPKLCQRYTMARSNLANLHKFIIPFLILRRNFGKNN